MVESTSTSGFDPTVSVATAGSYHATFRRTDENCATLEIQECRSGLAATIERSASKGTVEAIEAIRDEELRQMRENLGHVELLLTGEVVGSCQMMTGVGPTEQRSEERLWGRRDDRFEVEPVVSRSRRCFEGVHGMSDVDLIQGEIAEMIDIHEASIRAVYQAIVLEVECIHGGADGSPVVVS